MPKITRIAINGAIPARAAAGVSAVAADHAATPQPSVVFPPARSAHRPPTICVAPYP